MAVVIAKMDATANDPPEGIDIQVRDADVGLGGAAVWTERSMCAVAGLPHNQAVQGRQA